jgi:putative phosphoribosyl transferase
MSEYIFENREDASLKLIETLPIEILKSNELIVLAISKRGLYFSNKIAQTLNCKMDILLSEPIYSDINPSLAIAMVGETQEIVMHQALIDSFGISKDYIYSNAHQKYINEILKYINIYRDGQILDSLNQKFVLLVDESIESGLTVMTAIKTVIALGAKNVFVAVPILDNIIYKSLITICDNLFCPYRVDDYISIEYYFKELKELEFKEIESIIKSYKKEE